MKTIHKYRVPLEATSFVDTHQGAHFRHADVQHGQVTVWAEVDTAAPPVARRVEVLGTGHPMPTPDDLEYVDTFQTDGGAFVWHLYVARELQPTTTEENR